MNRREFMQGTIAVAALAAGCDRAPSSGGAGEKKGRVSMVAAVYPLAYFARQVGQDLVEVHCVVESGGLPSAVEADGDLRQRVGNARLVLVSGPWDRWASEMLSEDARAARVLSPVSMASARKEDGQAWHWLDPVVASEFVEKLREALTVLDPKNESTYRENARKVSVEINGLVEPMRFALSARASSNLLVVQPVWGAFCARFGLNQLAPVMNVETALTAQDYKELAAAARQNDLDSLCVDVATPIAVRQQIEQKTRLKLVLLDGLGSSAPEGRSTYARIMRYNLEQLKR